MGEGMLRDLLEDIIALAEHNETEEIIAICESKIKELNAHATNENV